MKTKLNVGSGHPKGAYREPEWINIDIAAKDQIDENMCVINVSVLDLPNDWENQFEVVHCIHMLEHMNRNKRQEVLNKIHFVMAPGGKLFLEVPDFEAVVRNLMSAYETNDSRQVHIWKTSIYGKQRYDGDSHHWGYDAAHLMELAKNAGFQKSQCWTNKDQAKMVSSHWKQEPVILLEATK